MASLSAGSGGLADFPGDPGMNAYRGHTSMVTERPVRIIS